MTLPTPTEEGQYILDLLSSTTANIMVDACPGSGKTTMLEIIHEHATVEPILFLAFNTRIRDRMLLGLKERMESREEARLPPLPIIQIRTLNGFGHSVWGQTIPHKLFMDPKKPKIPALLREAIRSYSKSVQREAYDDFWEIVSAVGLAKSLGYVPEGKWSHATRLCTLTQLTSSLEMRPSDLFLELLDTTLNASIQTAYAGNIDYNDQIYMPALFGGSFPNFPLVLVDEWQDLNPVNHEMLAQLKKSRLVAVGDPRQSIYAFRGAVPEGMKKGQERFGMTEATLSVSFRCPKTIVELLRWRAPKMQWRKPGGLVATLTRPTADTFVDNSAIICRNNAPLFSLALKLLTAGRSVTVAGSEIGPRVIAIMRKLGPEEMSRDETLRAIEDWLTDKLAKESKTAEEIADCMVVFAREGETLSQAIAYAQHIFEQSGSITLLTGHKAKGLEWEVVYHLDPFLLRNDEQDLNLRFVIESRSMNEYYEVNSSDIDWRENVHSDREVSLQ